jgi:hypothetical protein
LVFSASEEVEIAETISNPTGANDSRERHSPEWRYSNAATNGDGIDIRVASTPADKSFKVTISSRITSVGYNTMRGYRRDSCSASTGCGKSSLFCHSERSEESL